MADTQVEPTRFHSPPQQYCDVEGCGCNLPKPPPREMTAVFPRVREAVTFFERLQEKGEISASAPDAWHYVDGSLKQKGRTVTWQWSGHSGDDRFPDHSHNAYITYMQDMLECVGYYGSPPIGPKAKLNGVTAPPSF